MQFRIPSLFFLLPFALFLSSCLDDPITEPEVFPAPIEAPSAIIVRFLDYDQATGRGDLRVEWPASRSAGQDNHEGYLVSIYKVDTIAVNDAPYLHDFATDSAFTRKDTLFHIFSDLPPGNYLIAVWGKRFADPARPDSLVLSREAIARSIRFDPREVFSPPELRAVADGSSSVRLDWDPPSSNSNEGLLGYRIYYHDAAIVTNPKVFVGAFVGPTDSTKPSIQIVAEPSNTDVRGPVGKFWIKALRVDSVESRDSAIIYWSGAAQLHTGTNDSLRIGADSAIFFGSDKGGVPVNAGVDAGTAGAQIIVRENAGIITLEGVNGTTFIPKGDTVSELREQFFSRPFENSEFTENSITLPATASKNFVVYALFGTKTRARIMIKRQPNGTFVTTMRGIAIQASFQPVPDRKYF
jgi:hypothetical protein